LHPTGERETQVAVELCPYLGLETFREEHKEFFYGREGYVEELYHRLHGRQQRLTLLVGASGSGKSSVVQAGLLPRLRQAAVECVWLTATFKPGTSPFYNLAAAVLDVMEPDADTAMVAEKGGVARVDRIQKIKDWLFSPEPKARLRLDQLLQEAVGQ